MKQTNKNTLKPLDPRISAVWLVDSAIQALNPEKYPS